MEQVLNVYVEKTNTLPPLCHNDTLNTQSTALKYSIELILKHAS